ncbi:MAG TPA: ABC transporter substrate-binding protein [Trebonia sp.]|jgi:NitT/TauT family transport system substrate-binding protein|nr:ABC transporter substrate-binding protein [Trebonia sp.]
MSVRNMYAALTAITVMAVAVVGCTNSGGAGATATTVREEPDITIAAVPSADLAGLYIAQDDGFFAREGLHVKIVKIASSKAIVADQLAGKIDLCAGAYMPYISAEAAGKKFAILAEGSVMTPGTRALLVPKGSSLSSIGRLAGQTVGMNATNSIGTLLVEAALEEAGVNPKSVHFKTDAAGFPTMAKELSEGTWDAAFFGEPYLTQGEEEYGENTLVDLDQGALTGLPISGYIVTGSWLKEHPGTAAAFAKAIEAAELAADTDPNEARAAMAESDHLPSTVTALMSIPEFPTGPVDETRIEREALDMLDFGFLPQRDSAEIRNGSLVKAMIPGN